MDIFFASIGPPCFGDYKVMAAVAMWMQCQWAGNNLGEPNQRTMKNSGSGFFKFSETTRNSVPKKEQTYFLFKPKECCFSLIRNKFDKVKFYEF